MDASKIRSLEAELRDRATENRELQRQIGQALHLLESGRTEQAVALLRLSSRRETER